MKNRIHILLTITIIFVLSHLSIVGQTTNHIKSNKHFVAWITPLDSTSIIKGYLSEVEDSLIVVSNFYNYEKQNIYYYDIKEIKFRKKGKVGKGFLYGALTGFAVGAIAGFADGDDRGDFEFFTAEEKAILGGIVLAIPGALIGGVIGAAKIKIPINGDVMNQKEKLLKFKRSY